MILSAAVDNGQPGYPWLVFLHGFSGDRNEWRKVGDAFPAWPRLYLDLPGHGGSADIAVQDFAGVNTLLQSTLNSYNIHKYWLIGYSLGGRVAMNFASQPRAGMRGLIVEGGHPGLQDVEARQARRSNDSAWAERFRREPLEQVFADWYQQPVFASLNAAQRESLVALRSRNNGATLAAMLQATSLAARPICSRLAGARFSFSLPVRRARREVFAPSRRRSRRISILFTMPDTTRTGTTPGGGDCLSGADSGKLTEGHSMISLDEAMLSRPVDGTIAPKAIPIFAITNRLTGIAKITINRPQVRNAFRPLTVKEMIQALADARYDDNIGVIVLTGEGEKAFCAGGDQKVRGDYGGYQDDSGVHHLNVLDFQRQIRTCPKPVVAMVAGYSIGGGHVLHMMCDLTIAAENAIFGQTGPKVGSFDGGWGASYMARIVGQKKAREIWFLCRQYDAQQALDMGLVNTVVPLADLEKETVRWCREMLQNSRWPCAA